MKDIESLLQSMKSVVPKRRLGSSFADDVLGKINTKEEKGSIFMKLHKSPMAAVLSIALVLASGVTTFAAIANWPAVVSIFGGEQLLGSGARVVKIETEGCKPIEGSSHVSKRVSYYEIKKESSLTNEQAVAMMQGICEEERVQAKGGDFIQQVGGASYSTRIVTIENRGTHSLTVAPDKKYDQKMNTGRKTYTNIASDVKVNDGAVDLDFNALRPGDSVVLALADERGISTEMQGYTEDISKIQVKAILKVPALTGSPDLFYKHLGKDFVRVEPSKSGEGFTRLYEFQQ